MGDMSTTNTFIAFWSQVARGNLFCLQRALGSIRVNPAARQQAGVFSLQARKEATERPNLNVLCE